MWESFPFQDRVFGDILAVYPEVGLGVYESCTASRESYSIAQLAELFGRRELDVDFPHHCIALWALDAEGFAILAASDEQVLLNLSLSPLLQAVLLYISTRA